MSTSGRWGPGASTTSPGAHAPSSATTASLGGLALAGAGMAVGALFGLATRLRRDKPIHPKGAVLTARLHRDGNARSGVPWLDEAGEDDVVVRFSRSAGLGVGWPDVHGLAIRDEARGIDLLLSTTGARPGLRHVLRPGLRPDRGTYTSVVPFRGPRGPVLLAAAPPPGRRLPADPEALADDLTLAPAFFPLAWADLRSPWASFGVLEVGTRVDLLAVRGAPGRGPDVTLRFDPMRTPPGLDTYPWVARLREPAYAAARHHHPVDAGAMSSFVPTQRSRP